MLPHSPPQQRVLAYSLGEVGVIPWPLMLEALGRGGRGADGRLVRLGCQAAVIATAGTRAACATAGTHAACAGVNWDETRVDELTRKREVLLQPGGHIAMKRSEHPPLRVGQVRVGQVEDDSAEGVECQCVCKPAMSWPHRARAPQ